MALFADSRIVKTSMPEDRLGWVFMGLFKRVDGLQAWWVRTTMEFQ